jgi:predicted TIM-barrel fold metal-dependent hydrolase
MQIIDAHHHLWDLDRHRYPWLRPQTPHPGGDLTPICQSYRLEDFLADAAGLELVKSVHLQAEIDRSDPVAETAWLQAIADAPGSRGFPHGISRSPTRPIRRSRRPSSGIANTRTCAASATS